MNDYTTRHGMNRAYLAKEIFAPYYRLLNELRTGEVSCIDDSPVIEWKGELELAGPILHGWIAVWERIQAIRPCRIDLRPLSVIAHKLDCDASISADEVQSARESMDGCFRAYKRLPLGIISQCAVTEEIAVKMDRSTRIMAHTMAMEAA